jgi:hypothetical protein
MPLVGAVVCRVGEAAIHMKPPSARNRTTPVPTRRSERPATGRIWQHVGKWGNIEKAILLSPIHSQRLARSGNGGAETLEVLPC